MLFDRQAVHPGEPVEGQIELTELSQIKSVTVSLQGEEVLGANNIVRSFVLPVVDERKVYQAEDISEGKFSFCFTLPEDAPPTYASRDVRCQYSLKVHIQRKGWARDLIRRYHLAVLPRRTDAPGSAPTELILEEGAIKLSARLDQISLSTGQALGGSLLLETTQDNTPLPSRLTFRFAAIEESIEKGYHHREVLWLATHDVEPEEELHLPITGFFEFPIDREAPFSGSWNTFKVHYGFRVGMFLPGGRHIRESLPIRVYKSYPSPV